MAPAKPHSHDPAHRLSARPLPLNASELLDFAIAHFRSRTALEMTGTRVSYGQLGRRIRCLAQGLLDSGIRAGDRVAIVLPMSIDAVIAFHAVLRIGAIAVQHSDREPMMRLSREFADYSPVAVIIAEYRLNALAGLDEEARPKTVITVQAPELPKQAPRRLTFTGALAEIAKASGKGVMRVAAPPKGPAQLPLSFGTRAKLKDLLGSAPLPLDCPYPEPNDLAALVYEGGTRTSALGAMITHGNLTALAHQSLEYLETAPAGTETGYALWPLHSTIGIADTLTTSLFYGRHTILFPRFDHSALVRALKKNPPSVISGDTEVFRFLAEYARTTGKAPMIRLALSPIRREHTPNLRDWARDLGWPLVVSFDGAEAGVALFLRTSVEGREHTVGTPLPSIEVRVVNVQDRGHVVGPGTVGKLMIKGPQVFHGYWKKPDETTSVLSADGWVLTSSLASIDTDGYVTLIPSPEH
ncbi:AMP-binding protein [Dermabacter sp. Marseille-Q3180]|uniref:AMP-binding protein n=1 Tax=Dermabacter sp. Marseille-Q3180 TaxID=2758090 RepID=UPI0020258BDF|nr:AMP-binding protein [Dermabacter sp. Marseille-Q3180]